jgi:predicted membrane channel-forming protein YqfA (hemolysin III family)
MLPPAKALWLLIALAVALAAIGVALRPFPQPLAYHNFADHRAALGIPNFGDVASNLPFAIVGLWGLVGLLRQSIKFVGPREAWPYAIMFVGLILTAFGSTYYHLAPDNNRLVWDRIPILIAMMALVGAVVTERVSISAGFAVLLILELAGIGSVLAWRASELHGHGDLRFYAAMQLYAILALLAMLLVRPKYTRGSDLLAAVGFYALAKVLEETDRQVFALGHVVSGHTLKHLAAAAASFWILRMLQRRQPIPHGRGRSNQVECVQ